MQKRITFLAFMFLIVSLRGQLKVTKTYVDNKNVTIGVTSQNPRLSWTLGATKRGEFQSAYEVKVAETQGQLTKGENLVWSSGKIASEKSVHVVYEGKPLQTGKIYYWQVRVWNGDDRASKWSQPSSWQMGLLDPESDFVAKWIIPSEEQDTINRPSPYFRKEFQLNSDAKIKRATAYITAHGMYEAHLNGTRIGNACLTPGWTSYNDRLQYQMYDVTESLVKNNAIGAILGNGWYRDYLAWGNQRNHYGNDIALLFQLEIEYEDGTTQKVVSDDSWKYSLGAILNSEIYDGETYDANKELWGWSKAGYDANSWLEVKEADFDKSVLITTENEPVRKKETFNVVKVLETPEGDLVADFGQNLVGWAKIDYTGTKGKKITLHHTEVLTKEGNFYTENLREAEQKVTYILDGGAKRGFEPHFTFQGFRYVKVEGLKIDEIENTLTAVALYSDMEPTGSFTTSNELLNQLQHNIQWGQKGNFLDVPTDCPQRDERLGWTGDAQAFFRTAAYNMNVHPFFTKWMKDVATDQNTNGSIPFVVPNVLGENAAGSAGWGDVATIIPWESYVLYGDRGLLENQYPSMKAWVEFIRSQSTGNLWNTGFHFGDWLFYSPDDDRDGKAAITDKYLITQCFYAYSTQLLLKAATVLGKKEDIQTYSSLLSEVVSAFQKEYLTSSGRLVSGTQTAYVLALQFDLLPVELRQQAADRLAENIKDYGYHLTTGFLGTPYLNHVLSRFGHNDIAYKLLLQDTYPSWLYPVTQGATTIWERWDGIKPDGSFQTPSMNSYNHYAYGAIGDWMYQHIAGIQALEESPGYKKFKIAPVPGGGLSTAEGRLKTYYGDIQSSWRFEDKNFMLHVEVPVNTKAEVVLPFGTWETIKEGNSSLERAKNIDRKPDTGQKVVLEIPSGSYNFQIPVEDRLINTNSFTGRYRFTSGFSFALDIVEVDAGNINVTSANGTDNFKVSEKDPLRFEGVGDGTQSLKFFKNSQGEIEGLEFYYGNQRFEAIKQ